MATNFELAKVGIGMRGFTEQKFPNRSDRTYGDSGDLSPLIYGRYTKSLVNATFGCVKNLVNQVSC